MRIQQLRTEQDLITKVKHLVHTEYEHESHGYETEEQLLCMVIAYLMAEEVYVKSLTNAKMAALIVKGIGPIDTEDAALNWMSDRYGSLNADMAFLAPEDRADAMHKALTRLTVKVEYFPYDNIAITE